MLACLVSRFNISLLLTIGAPFSICSAVTFTALAGSVATSNRMCKKKFAENKNYVAERNLIESELEARLVIPEITLHDFLVVPWSRIQDAFPLKA